jgi:hypothetical protein
VSGRLVKMVLENAPEDLTQLELLVLVSIAESSRDGDRSTRGGAGSADTIAFRVRSTPGSVRNVLSRLTARALIKPLNTHTIRGRAQRYELAELHEWHRETRHRIEQ